MQRQELDISIMQVYKGRYGSGEINSSGKHLAEFVLINDLFLTNTKFTHKMCYRTMWKGPERTKQFTDKNGGIREKSNQKPN